MNARDEDVAAILRDHGDMTASQLLWHVDPTLYRGLCRNGKVSAMKKVLDRLMSREVIERSRDGKGIYVYHHREARP